jgi:GNAT superfamily N-acetyltransferase
LNPHGWGTVRALARSDQAQWRGLWDAYNRFYERVGEAAIPEDVTVLTWERFFEPEEPLFAIVAEAGDGSGHLLGLTHFMWHRTTAAQGPVCYLEDLFTVDSARGQGIGRALIEAVVEQARAKGCVNVYWQTHESNATAQRLYRQVAERSGFLVYQRDLG